MIIKSLSEALQISAAMSEIAKVEDADPKLMLLPKRLQSI